MNVCPFCKAKVSTSYGPCPKCGKLASDHPSIAASGGRNLGDDFGDDDEGNDLVLESGSSVGGGASGSAYGGNDSSFGSSFDSDPPPGGMLELDLPPMKSGAAPRPSGGVPDLDLGTAKKTAAGPSANAPTANVSAPPPSSSRSGGHPVAPSPPISSGSLPAPGPSSGRLPAETSGAHVAAAPPPIADPIDPAAIVVAKYPPSPQAMWQAPIYACKVLWRQLELRQDLESLRKRRSPDVGLYERALKAHDKKAFALGLAIVIAMMTIATFVFFLPVIIRFVRSPD